MRYNKRTRDKREDTIRSDKMKQDREEKVSEIKREGDGEESGGQIRSIRKSN